MYGNRLNQSCYLFDVRSMPDLSEGEVDAQVYAGIGVERNTLPGKLAEGIVHAEENIETYGR